MPSLSAHFACAKLIEERLDIKNRYEFLRGTVYPDMIKNSHFKIKSSNEIFMVPSILDFLQSIEYDLNDFEKGYLVHLLLDKYYLEKFAYKFGLEQFLNGNIYEDYSLISVKLLNDFNVDVINVSNTIMSFENKIDKDKLIKMCDFFTLKDRTLNTKIIDYNEFKNFILDISDIILLETEDIIKKRKKLEKKI